MEQYIHFAGNHWELFAAFSITLLMLLFNLFGDRLRGFESIPPEAAVRILNRDGSLLLDVRSKEELGRDGHIKDATHIPLNALKEKIPQLESYRNQAVTVICRSGSRSGVACAQLKKQGFEEVYNLKGGILSWKSAGLPVSYK